MLKDNYRMQSLTWKSDMQRCANVVYCPIEIESVLGEHKIAVNMHEDPWASGQVELIVIDYLLSACVADVSKGDIVVYCAIS